MPRALVTGPTSGIGHSFARALAAEGHDLVLVSRNVDRLRSVGDDLAATYGVRAAVEAADLSVRDDIRRIEALIVREPVDVLVNNAGFGLGASMLETDIEDEQRSLDVHITAVLRLTRAALPAMVSRGSGEIVNVSSVSGFLARGTYGAHKAWVTRFSRSMNAQHGTDDLRIMALCPGFVHTEFHARSGADAGRIPNWMWLDPDDVVREALDDLRAGRAVSIPSRRWRALVRGSRLVPDKVVARFATLGR
jgi:short-subunit dehydrogenase